LIACLSSRLGLDADESDGYGVSNDRRHVVKVKPLHQSGAMGFGCLDADAQELGDHLGAMMKHERFLFAAALIAAFAGPKTWADSVNLATGLDSSAT